MNQSFGTKMVRKSLFSALILMSAGAASAQTKILLPDSGQTTTVTANVSEQALVSVPAAIAFNVTDTSAVTDASAAAIVNVDNIVMDSPTKCLQISMKANSTGFSHAMGGTSWDASDLSWNAAGWSNLGDGEAANLVNDASTYSEIALCAPGSTSCSSSDLMFKLAAKPEVQYAGAHTMVVTWKFSSIGS